MKTKLLICVLVLIFTGCSSQPVFVVEKSIPVKTELIHAYNYQESLSYKGVIQPSQIKKYSFKTAGYLERIHVSPSEKVVPGQVLASLDTTELMHQAESAKNTMDAAYSQYEKALKGASQEEINAAAINVDKAQNVLEFRQKNHEDLTVLYEEGVVSLSSLEESALGLSIAEKDYLQSQEVLNQALSGAGPETVQAAYSQFLAAQNGYQAYMSLIDDATIYSDVDGSVVSILYETSEAVPAGYPAVIVSSRQLLIQTSVTRSDLQRLSLITPCEVVVNDQIYEGVIQEINRFPDENKLTYPVSIMVVDPPNDLLVGDLASIRFLLEEVNGIWLDIMTISNDGSDFVFVVENNRVTKRSIEILSVMNDKVLVDGLNVGDEVIVKGFNQVRIGSVVDVQQ